MPLSKEAQSLLDSMMSYYKQNVIDKLPPPLYNSATKLWSECWGFGSESKKKKRQLRTLNEMIEFCEGWNGKDTMKGIPSKNGYPFESIELVLTDPIHYEIVGELHKNGFYLEDALPPLPADNRKHAQLTFKREVLPE